MREALIQVRPGGKKGIDRTLKTIEELGGAVLMTFLPHAIVASLPEEKVTELRKQPGIRSVDTGEITEDRLKVASETVRVIMVTWNGHLLKKGRPAVPPSAGLPWDADKHQPPDAPPHIQEMLRRREKEMKNSSDRQ